MFVYVGMNEKTEKHDNEGKKTGITGPLCILRSNSLNYWVRISKINQFMTRGDPGI